MLHLTKVWFVISTLMMIIQLKTDQMINSNIILEFSSLLVIFIYLFQEDYTELLFHIFVIYTLYFYFKKDVIEMQFFRSRL
ncbi:hypothetical protein GLOIN_2v1612757 [Rhizophagus irregularis DAOM 181602=DAOM 197198]|uniref:Uncharacterized protein n=1 Tax=Rhizophagus irregularis (strain DAOM 181602 / DAOM 197198 / MUCL 43194) TaxID=747089 RepID=A0A2P4PZP5_RHIID|nr:hypothetical protein GLOIN_2v1612757 [Rhizophagus irregularis DAOM 181602=DAOM 197198]POG70864.1 hypothetical protein GLOIN_2v1612757 [Rhizophagus irregularis DAOM 181602=DAOM 197198]GET53563.1 hypothetical protein GLOIN_2v1612757 [Rhizophagus irregularis DAOM 181602=DAOM 197198]|eukprot:XP_025177730.1 hypothetical protein GLOIN_2v1612757 [Rhizophagus irregularis DAOM 181602=DAOM 197198]